MPEFFDNDIKFIKGVGEARANTLSKETGVANFRDLLYYFPFRHVDRSRFYSIAELQGEDLPALQIKGQFISFSTEGEGARKRLKGIFSDGRKMIETVWFNNLKYFSSQYKPGVEYVIFGKPVLYHHIYSIAHPEVEIYNPEKPPTGFRGVYTITEGLRKKGFSVLTFRRMVEEVIKNPGFQTIPETLPTEIIQRYHLMPLKDALINMHFPQNPENLQKAIERFKFEELYYIELNILRFSMERGAKIKGYPFTGIGEKFNGFYNNGLPFELTGAQKRVLKEIWKDMKGGRQMNRLLQGDVGSGKTMVAFLTALMAIDNGFQAAIMAPTEILATQHYDTISQWAEKCGVTVGLLTGSTRQKERKILHEALQDGSLNLLIGTHALLEDNVQFQKLGTVVIDEQHRFGVAQRAKMWKKGDRAPHVLVMTATPIPRTLAMTVYGDLDVSVIDELPPGRTPINTLVRWDSSRVEVDNLIFSQLKQGRQVYIVYPLIQDNEKLDLKSLELGYQRTCDTFVGYKVCYVHGKMKAEEKERQMDLFLRGEADIMVATTVIEVGVNVPNATVMVIENAERFGLSQLHQLRGRVGRGAKQSYCVLMGKQTSGADTKKRLAIMAETTDGFLISEADMKMRGPGDMEGTMQSGMPFTLRVANLARDGQILSRAREAALSVLAGTQRLLSPGASSSPNEKIENPISLNDKEIKMTGHELRLRFARSIDWSLIS
ncbi:MAG: ATP-dependent DNA helicase RecG [Muribaculaceae bacterium]|nr:ATP-dependent DNA helicase RecG [Muribaculaceae bacterium]